MTTKADCAKKIAAYLASEISHEELLNWADAALVAEDFPAEEGRVLLEVLSDLSAGRTSGYLSQIESYQALLRELGFRMETRLVAA
jgi:imidazolonepropionase-like amidohydrolase